MILSALQSASLKKNHDIKFVLDQNLTKFNSLRLKAYGDLITIKSAKGLNEVIHFLKTEKLDYRIIGQGSNLVLPMSASWIYLKLDFPLDPTIFEEVRDEYILPASVQLNLLTQYAAKEGLKGWEVFTGIPASLGGAVTMNAGTNLGEIGSIVVDVQILKSNGTIISHSISPDSFRYRGNHFLQNGDVIYSVKLKHFGIDPDIPKKIRTYQALRKKTQPLHMPTCGCVFKNRKILEAGEESIFPAGQLIDSVGLKGKSVKKLQISSLHANFFENLGGATKEDFLELVEIVQNEVQSKYGFNFEMEVEIW